MCRSKAEGGRRCPGSGGMERELTDIIRGLQSAETSTLTEKVIDAVPAPEQSPATESLNPNTPHYNSLLVTPTEKWFSMPWKERKATTEQALREVLTLTGSEAVFVGWSRSKTSLGKALYQRNRVTGEVRRGVELSDVNGRFSEPITIADTIAHEVAHTLAPPSAGHGRVWVDVFEGVKNELNLVTEITQTHSMSEAESQQRRKDAEEKKRNALWQGRCPQGHAFSAGRKPKYEHSCVTCDRNGDSARITYERNQNRGGKK